MQIAICEDNAADQLRLHKLLQGWLLQEQMDAQISIFGSGEALLSAWSPGVFQIIFMDIYLDEGKKDGIQTSRAIRKDDADCVIILTTTSTAHGLAGFAVNATHYLLKPVEYESLCEALRRCRPLLEEHARYIDITENRLPLRVLWRDIAYIEVYGNNSVIHTGDRQIKVYATLESLLELLSSPPFLRCHRSYAVNLQWVERLQENAFLLCGGQSAPIGRVYRGEARQAYDDYLAELVQRRYH